MATENITIQSEPKKMKCYKITNYVKAITEKPLYNCKEILFLKYHLHTYCAL